MEVPVFGEIKQALWLTITAWSIYGGTPYYLQTIDPEQSLGTNVQQSILLERGLLYSEPEFLRRTELR